jgi:hypothetical protein
LRTFQDLLLQCLERTLAVLTKDEREPVKEKCFNPLLLMDQMVCESPNYSWR